MKLLNLKSDKGTAIIDATFVFPVMFFILFFLIFMGNAFYQRAKIDSLVSEYAIIGSAYCSDPLIEGINGSKNVPTSNKDIQPYRYVLNGMGSVESKIENKLKNEISGDGFFAGMAPKLKKCNAKYNNSVIYSTFSVEVDYVIEFPIKFLGDNNIQLLKISARDESPVVDTSEFIRNTDMAIDYLQHSEFANSGIQKIKDAIAKVKAFVSFN